MHSRFIIPLLSSLGGVMLWLVCLSLLAAPVPPEDLKQKVKGLIEQLADKDRARQEAAATALIKLGPEILPLLPPDTVKRGENQDKALDAVRKALREQRLRQDLMPRLLTLELKDLTLSKALAQLATRTGITVEDRREANDDPPLKLRLNNATFWQALDAIAQEADVRLGLYERDGKIALRRRPESYQNAPVSYDGLFRTSVKRISAVRNLDADLSHYEATLEVAWEPRFRPFLLEVKPADLNFRDDSNRALTLDQEASNKLSISNKAAVAFDVPLPSLERKSTKLGLLKGKVILVGPIRMDTFTFDSTLAEMVKDPKKRELKREGITVKVSQLDLARDHWTLVMELDYPAEGPHFESFESWLVYNEISLKKKDDGETFPNNGGYVIDSSAGTRAVVSYHFVDEPSKKLLRGKSEDWTVVYRTPGTILEIPVAFEFKDLPLP